jgi:hypothetical protein
MLLAILRKSMGKNLLGNLSMRFANNIAVCLNPKFNHTNGVSSEYTFKPFTAAE